MTKNLLLDKLNEVEQEMSVLEKYYRKRYNQAVDIEDVDNSKLVKEEAFVEIRNLKEWKRRILELHLEVDSSMMGERTNEIRLESVLIDDIRVTDKATRIENIDDEIPIKKKQPQKRKPSRILLLNQTYPVRYWNEILLRVCETAIIKKPSVVKKFDKLPSLNDSHDKNFSFDENEIFGNKKRLSNGLWVRVNHNRHEVILISEKVLGLVGLSENDLMILYE